MRQRIQKVLSGLPWRFPLVAGMLISHGALGMTAMPVKACESKAQARYRKRAVETEMEGITGNLSELELRKAKAMLLSRYEIDRQSCQRIADSAVDL